MKFSVLASGSRGNATYIESGNQRLLIDCGLSARQIELRLRMLGVDPASLDAILITHDHRDHTCGVSVMSRRFRLPVWANEGTAETFEQVYAVEQFETGVEFTIGDITIEPFRISHDAADPVGFAVTAEGLRFCQATDMGHVTPLVRASVRCANVVVLESNHDVDMLWGCDYPWYLKKRIASTHGHLSNEAAGELLAEVLHPELFHIVLAHISENSNTPERALSAASGFVAHEYHPRMSCAGPYAATPLIEVASFRAAANG